MLLFLGTKLGCKAAGAGGWGLRRAMGALALLDGPSARLLTTYVLRLKPSFEFSKSESGDFGLRIGDEIAVKQTLPNSKRMYSSTAGGRFQQKFIAKSACNLRRFSIWAKIFLSRSEAAKLYCD